MYRESKRNRYERSYNNHQEYISIVDDILDHPKIQQMSNYSHHGDTDTLQHSMNVSYYTYLLAKERGLDYESAARGGLLHDFFLYDWHDCTGPKLEHTYGHPIAALINAENNFDLNDIEREIIARHMYPAVPDRFKLPKHRETYCIAVVDKIVCCAEVMNLTQRVIERRVRQIAYGEALNSGILIPQ